MPTLTVFTPTYNRKNTLPRLYCSLQRQTCLDFLWLLIDDGSQDNTEELVKEWIINENKITIQYIKKENGGLHTAYNIAIENMNTELAVCIDSDDYMPDDAVEKIIKCWKKNKRDDLAGIVGLDYNTQGELIGGLLPNTKTINIIDISNGKLKIKKGDKKNVVRVDLYKSVAPMPTFPGEKNFNPHYMHLLIGEKYNFIPLNECLCIVDYQPNGMTSNMFKQYKNSPNSFLELRKLVLKYGGMTIYDTIRTTIHFDSEALLSHRWVSEYRNSNYKLLMLLCLPFGVILKYLTIIKG